MKTTPYLLLALAACADPALAAPDPASDPAGALSAGAAADAAAAAPGPKLVQRPSITGDATVGSKITATAGTWSTASPTLAYQWRRCDAQGRGCVDIPGETRSTYVVTGDDPMHKLRVRVTATTGAGSTGAASPGRAATFPEGTVCNGSADAFAAPDVLEHVIVILMENRDADAVDASSAPYFDSISAQCASSSQYVDNLFPSDINSLSHYLALTSGSNCNSGLGTSGSGCVTDDNGPSSHTLTTESIFDQVTSWRSYEEDMPSNCNTGNPAGGTNYWVKHNPAAYYNGLAGCSTDDIGIARVSCPSSANATCGTPANAFVDDLANDTLPQFSFVTPDIQNDMHDSGVPVGDNWLHTYLPLILESPAYLRGGTAVYVLWDEQESFNGGPIPNLFVSPYLQPTVSTATVNHFAALRTIEDQLGISTHLGCASGTAPGGGSCPTGSTTDLRAELGF